MLLRSRVTMSTAIVVAVAIATISTTAWFTTRHHLLAQLDQTLLSRVPPPGAPKPPGMPPPDFRWLCGGSNGRDLRHLIDGIQLLRADGQNCAPPGADRVVVLDSDRAGRADTLRDGRTASGAAVRVLVNPLPRGDVLLLSHGLAEVDDTLVGLGRVLVAVSLLGAVLAAVAGHVLTRRALAPMERLTSTAEEIARTEDLRTPVTVRGQDEVGRLGRAFTRMTTALAESRRRQRALVDDAAHELRTPLTSLRTNVDLLARSERVRRPLPPARRAEILDRVGAQVREFGDLVTELVVLARDERELRTERVDMAVVVERAVHRARNRAGDRALEVRGVPWSVVGDPVALERTVLNLLDNAIKFSPLGSTITVRSGRGRLTVADEGPGVPPAHREEAFQRFWRAPDARALPGSGLGLAIVRDTVAAHGGAVRFVDPPGDVGAVVRVDLPVAD